MRQAHVSHELVLQVQRSRTQLGQLRVGHLVALAIRQVHEDRPSRIHAPSAGHRVDAEDEADGAAEEEAQSVVPDVVLGSHRVSAETHAVGVVELPDDLDSIISDSCLRGLVLLVSSDRVDPDSCQDEESDKQRNGGHCVLLPCVESRPVKATLCHLMVTVLL